MPTKVPRTASRRRSIGDDSPPSPPSPSSPLTTEQVRERIRRGSLTLSRGSAPLLREDGLDQGPSSDAIEAAWTEHTTKEGATYYFNSLTRKTTWDTPTDFALRETRRKSGSEVLAGQGEWAWVRDEIFCFAVAQRNEKNGRKFKTLDGREITVEDPEKDVLGPVLNIDRINKDTDDMVKMQVINEATVLHNLRLRTERDDYFTNVGSILISVNPFKWIDKLYTAEQFALYRERAIGDDVPPHFFEISDNAYRGLRDDRISQSIIISGESGAGKTEATKKCLQYLADVAGSTIGLENKLLATNPILEAFGNAKTLRNGNSSRFGKWTAVQFDALDRIASGHIVNYLLEKSRVSTQIAGERNFHIFYQLVKGASEKQRDVLRLPKACSLIKYLHVGGCTDILGVDDEEAFAETTEALDELGFSDDEQTDILRVVAGVMWLGNLEFRTPTGGSADDACEVHLPTSESAITAVCDLLGFTRKELLNNVQNRIRTMGGQVIASPLNAQAAEESCAALAREIYGRLFDWLVKRVNVTLAGEEAKQSKNNVGSNNNKNNNNSSSSSTSVRMIGALDIFGFEIFEHNSFEQLCINFANEKLQQHFNQHTFKTEQHVYEDEGIDFITPQFKDNADVLSLLEDRPRGLLVLLDEECVLPRGSDASYNSKIVQFHGGNTGHSRFQSGPKIRAKRELSFAVEHYAGLVVYSAEGFLEKNKDDLRENLLSLALGSSNRLMGEYLFTSNTIEDDGTVSTTKRRHKTQASFFCKQLEELMRALNDTNPHYVRCIKPNNEKAPDRFDPFLCLEQLRYSGVFEAIEIRKQGFPFRRLHEMFYRRYRVLASEQFISKTEGTLMSKSSIDRCKALLDDLQAHQDESTRDGKKADLTDCRIGRTMVLYRAPEHLYLEAKREAARAVAGRVLTRIGRGFLARARVANFREIQQSLNAAIQSRELMDISEAVFDAEERVKPPFNLHRELREARETMAEIEKELTLCAQVEDLEAVLQAQPAAAADRYEEIEDTLSACERLQIAEKYPELAPVIKNFDRRIQGVRNLIQAKKELRSATHASFKPDLVEAIKRVEALQNEHGAPFCEEELREAKDRLEQVVREEKVSEALLAGLEKGGPRGEPGNLDRSKISSDSLRKAWTKAANMQDDLTPRGKALADYAELILALRDSMKKCDWPSSETLLARANQLEENGELERFHLPRQELDLYKAEVACYTVVAEISSSVQHDAVAGDATNPDVSQASSTRLREDIEDAKMLGSSAAVAKNVIRSAEKHSRLREAARDFHFEAMAPLLETDGAQIALNEGLDPNDMYAKMYLEAVKSEQELIWKIYYAHLLESKASEALCKPAISGKVGKLKVSSSKSTRDLDEVIDWVKKILNGVGPSARSAALLILVQYMRSIRVDLLKNANDFSILENVREAQKLVKKHDAPDQCRDELNLVLHDLTEKECIHILQKAVRASGAVSGTVGHLKVNKIDTKPLESALKDAQSKLDAIASGSQPQSTLAQEAFFAIQELIDLRSAIIDDNWDQVESILLAGAEQKESFDATEIEVELIQDELNNRTIIAELTKALSSGAPSGPIGELDLSSIDVESLQADVNDANELGCHTKEAKELLENANLVLRIRRGLVSEDWDMVEHALDEARFKRILPLAEDEVKTATKEMNNRRILHSLEHALRSGGPSGTLEDLRVDTITFHVLDEALALAQKLRCESGRAQHLFAASKIVRAARAALAEKRFIQLGPLVDDAVRQSFLRVEDHDVGIDETKLRDVEPAQKELELMRDKYEDESMCHDLAEALLQGQPKGRIGAIDLASVKLGNLIKVTEKYSEHESKTTSAAQLLESAKVAVSLREALLAGPDWTAAEAILKRYSPETILAQHGFSLVDSVEQEVTLISDEIENRKIVASLTSAIRQGAVGGSIGALDLDQLSVVVLNDAIEKVKKMQCKSSESKQLFETAKRLRDVRACVADADGAARPDGSPDAVQWLGAVQVALDKAHASKIASVANDELKLIQNHVDDIKIVRELCAALSQGQVDGKIGDTDPSSCNVERLDAALDCVHTLVCKTERAKKLEKTAKLVAQLRKSLLTDGWSKMPQLLEKNLGVSVQGGAPPDTFAGCADEASGEFQRLVDECRERAVTSQTLHALEHGSVQGTPGVVNISNLDTKSLTQAIAFADRARKHLSSYSKDLASLASILLLVREGFEHGGREGDEVEIIAAALAKLPSFDTLGEVAIPAVTRKELELAHDHVNDFRIRTTIQNAVQNGHGGHPLRIADIDVTGLRDAVSAVNSALGGPKSREAQDLVNGADLILQMRTALLKRDYEALRYILNEALDNSCIARMSSAKDQVYHARCLLVNHDTVTALAEAVKTGTIVGGDEKKIEASPKSVVSARVLWETLKNAQKQIGGEYDPEVIKLCDLCEHLAELRDAFRISNSDQWASVSAKLTAMSNFFRIQEDEYRAQAAAGTLAYLSEHDSSIDLVKDDIRTEYEEIRGRHEDRMVQRMLLEAMSDGALQGRVGSISTSSLQVAALQGAVEAAGSAQRPSRKMLAYLREAKYLLDMRRAILSDDWQATYDIIKHWREDTPEHSASGDLYKDLNALVRVFTAERSLASEESTRRVVVDDLSHALSTGGIVGVPGELSTQHVSVAQLNRAIARALEVGVNTPDAQQLMLAAHTVRQIRNGILASPDEGGGDGHVDCPLVRDALRTCEEEHDGEDGLPEVARREILLIKHELEDQDSSRLLTDALAWAGPETVWSSSREEFSDDEEISEEEGGDSLDGFDEGQEEEDGINAFGLQVHHGDEEMAASSNDDRNDEDDESVEASKSSTVPGEEEVKTHDGREGKIASARDQSQYRSKSLSSKGRSESGGKATKKPAKARRYSRYLPSRINVDKLSSAIAKTQESKCHTVYSRALYKLAFFVRDLRAACLETAWDHASSCITAIDRIRDRVCSREAPISTQSGESGQWRAALALIQPEVERARDEIETLETVSELRQALSSGQAPGQFGYLRIDRLDVSFLDKALGRASRARCRSEESITLRKTASLLRQLRMAVRNEDYTTASVVLAEAQSYASSLGQSNNGRSEGAVLFHRLPVAGSEIELLHHEVENKLAGRALKAALRSGAVSGRVGAVSITSSNVSSLERAMAKAESLARITDETRALVHSCRVVLRLRQILMDSPAFGALTHYDEISRAPQMWETAIQVLRSAVANVPEGNIPVQEDEGWVSMVSTAPAGLNRRRSQSPLSPGSQGGASVMSSDRDARSFSLLWCHPEARRELALLLDEIQHREAVQSLVRALGSGHAKFLGGFVDVATVKTGALEAAITTAKKVPTRTDELTSLQFSSSVILRCREALLDGSWQDLDNLLRDCAEMRIHEAAADELNLLRRETHLHNVIKSVLVRLQEATKHRDVDALEQALEEAETLRLSASPDLHVLSRVNKARQLLDRLMMVDERLDQCFKRADLQGLDSTLEEARRLKYNPRTASTAMELRDRLHTAFTQAERAVETVDVTAMRALLEQARREHIDLPRTDEMRRLLSMPPAQLERLRLNAAVERGDEDTVVDVTLAIKSRFFEQEATREKHRLELFPALKSPSEFAANTGAVAPGLASGMLAHSSTPIPTSLSRLPSTPATSLAVKVFRALLGYMGDREYSYPASLAQEILQVGLAVTELRDEILLQILKQLTDNPSAKSRQRGWLLMSLVLRTFPPSELFENYLELWLRRKGVELRARAGSSETNNWAHLCLNQMHRIVFRGPADAIPPLDEVHHLLQVNPSEHSRLTSTGMGLVSPNRYNLGNGHHSPKQSLMQDAEVEHNQNYNFTNHAAHYENYGNTNDVDDEYDDDAFESASSAAAAAARQPARRTFVPARLNIPPYEYS